MTSDLYDQLIADASFDDSGIAELGSYTLNRISDTEIEVYQWVNNEPVLKAIRITG